MKALLLIADGFEDISVYMPWYRLQEEGIEVHLASPFMHCLTGQHGYRIEPDLPIRDANPADYELLLIPDGIAVERLRQVEESVAVARTFVQENLRVAALGHGPQLLISAGTLDGKAVTCSPGIRDDVRMAGAVYRDVATVLDGNLLTGRSTDELPEFCRALAKLMRVPAGSRV
jgi:protease I